MHADRTSAARSSLVVAAVALACGSGAAMADNSYKGVPAKDRAVVSHPKSEDSRDAATHVRKAEALLRQMNTDPHARDLLSRAKGVFLVPDYGRAALGVGGQGGAGVLLVHENGRWSGPGFYNFGGASIGLQAGVSAGRIAMILMDQKAVDAFAQNNKFSLNADAGLVIVNYSERAHGEAGRGDIIVWSDTKGLFANASISVTDVNFDENETAALYGRTVSPRQIADGSVNDRKAASLLSALPG